MKQLGLQKQVRPCKAIKYLERTFNVVIIAALTAIPAFAATDMWTKANEVMKDVYNQILAISTIAAVVCGATALLLMNFSRNGKAVDERLCGRLSRFYHPRLARRKGQHRHPGDREHRVIGERL